MLDDAEETKTRLKSKYRIRKNLKFLFDIFHAEVGAAVLRSIVCDYTMFSISPSSSHPI